MLITDLGHEEPTVLLTNDLRTTPAKRITRYAQRMLIENGLADAVQFFHLDALSSAVRLKIDFDVTLTEVASGLYRMLGRRLAGYESAQSRQLFRHFLNTPAEVEITEERVEVTLPKRAPNPLLLAAGFGQGSTPIPWWDGRCAGINRHAIRNERVLQERSSESILTPSLAGRIVRCDPKRRQGQRRAGY